jgi:hypothetical protein
MKNQELELKGELNAAEIEVLKKKHPTGVYELKCENLVGYVRKPTREEMKYALTFATQNDPLGMAEALLESIWIGGESELIQNDDYFYSVASQVQSLVELKTVELKKF